MMDGGDLSKKEELIGPGGGVAGSVDVKAAGEQQLVMALPASEGFPAVSAAVSAPVVSQVVEKRKRGRPSRGLAPKLPPQKWVKEEEEDVCFICFDGGSLVLCDRKGCPKAYHPACIKRDEEFFRSKAKWDCGWHICSACQRASHYMCYTCTYSLCKKCSKEAEYVCVRGNKGFCSICMKTIMMIENKDVENKESIQVDFDDKGSWEYLFKMYWTLLKNKLSLTLDELIQAKNPWRGTNGMHFKPQIPGKDVSAEVDGVPILLKCSEHAEQKIFQELHEGGAVPILATSDEQSEQKVLKEQHQLPEQNSSRSENLNSEKSKNMDGCMDWASKELLEFVAHMKNGDTSVLSQFDVQALLMEYIKKNNLRDPHQKSQIICDLRLKMLFGKPRVGHIEMLKLLEYHFLIKEDTQKNALIPAGIVGCASDIDAGLRNNAVNQSKKQRTRKKVEERAPQVNLNEYAAIDAHNIKLIFLRRSMMESLIDEVEKFHDKVVGSIVRIRVSGNDQKQDIYRLVQVVGTSKATEPYKIGDKTTDIMLEVLNLDKKETMSIDGISNQEFSEDECRRLRQSIKCGLVKQMTVGDIQMKAMALQALRFDDWLVAEILRLSHLRDRANEKGHKKELRECVEKLQLLKTPEERQRKLTEIPEVHADPKMNPDYESGDDKGENEKKQDEASRRTRNHPFRLKKSVKEDAAVSSQRVQQKRDGGGGANSSRKKENNVPVGGFSSVSSNLRSDSESAVIASVSRISPPTSNIETEKIWHYRDPNGKVQGPFTMVQLQKWSTTGYFPADMRIWTENEQDHSILLNDALAGKFHMNFALSQSISSQYQGVATENHLSVGDSSRTLCSESRSNGAQEGVASEFSDWGANAVNKEKQSGNMQCSDLTKNVTAYVDRPVYNNDNVEQKSADPLHQVTKLDVDDVNNAGRNENSYDSALHHSPGIESEGKVIRNQNHECQSSGQTRLPVLLNLDLNDRDCTPASVTNPSESSEHKGDLNLVDLPSPTPNTDKKDLENQPNEQDSIFMDIQAAEMLRSLSACVPANGTRNTDARRPAPSPLDEDLPSPTPKSIDEKNLANPDQKPGYEDQAGQSSAQLQISPKDTGGSGANSQVVGEAQVQEAGGIWDSSPARAEPSCKEWDFGLVPLSSLKPPEVVGDQVATSNVNNNHHPHSSQSHPSHSVSSWLGVVNEPIEFSTLAEESVSDLLAEVDAMESQTGMHSPSSAMRCGDDMVDRNDCFSSIEELSPNTDAGKSDAVSSNPDNQFPSRPAEIDNPMGASQSQGSLFDPLKRSGGHPMTSDEGETKSAIYPINIWDTSPDVHPQPPCNLNQVNPTSHNWANVQGNMNMGWAGPPQAFANVGWRPSLGTPWANPNLSLGAYNGNAGWENQQRFGGNRDWPFQGGDLGYARPMWSRQQHGGGGGYARPPPKGQRVCKFYESGHCKKGASCGYLHP